jgi:site-specific DNA-methyltransferase (adenine-specific)
LRSAPPSISGEFRGRWRRLHPAPVLAVADARALPLPDACVDLLVTSPPYALDIEYVGGDVRADRWPDFMASWLAEALRVAKPHGRLAVNVPLDTTRGGKRPTYAQACHAALEVGWTYQATITWHEGHTSKGDRALGTVNSSRRPHPIDASEMIVLLSKGAWGPSSANPDDVTPAEWRLYGRGPWRFPGEPRRPGGHPAPFPEELPYRLIRYLSRVGDVVLDPFVGSGTTTTVAQRLGRQAVGFDLAPSYVETARRRLPTTSGAMTRHPAHHGDPRDRENRTFRGGTLS